jgi:hypothetical protein
MDNTQQILDDYLAMSGQDLGELTGGGTTFGLGFIFETLVPKALAERKRILWVPDLQGGEDVGLVKYELQDI